MAGRAYVPDRGDVVWIDFDPRAGHEQAGRRPALVLSPKIYNRRSGLMLCCPITNQVKGYPFEVAVPARSGTTGVVLADHVKSLDWKARGARKRGKAPRPVVIEVFRKLHALL